MRGGLRSQTEYKYTEPRIARSGGGEAHNSPLRAASCKIFADSSIYFVESSRSKLRRTHTHTSASCALAH